jgi:myosin heavy subunit
MTAESTFLTSLKMDAKAQSKQNTRKELLESIPNTGPKILSLHQDLQKLADTLDEKVEDMLNEHEKDFFLAYKNHMYTVQKEFQALKQKADEEETKTRRDAKIHSLEKELDWFMNEALRLDELCKKYKRELDKWKAKAEALDDDRQFLESQIKTAKRHNTQLRGAVEKAQTSAYSALVMNDDRMLPAEENGESNNQDQAESPEAHTGIARELEERYVGAIKSLKHQLESEQRAAAKMRSVSERQFGEPSELEAFFIRCVDKVKGNIIERRRTSTQNSLTAPKRSKKVPGYPATQSGSVDQINVDEFTAADRRHVVELLLSSEQVLVFLYDKLFPKHGDAPTPSQLMETLVNQVGR